MERRPTPAGATVPGRIAAEIRARIDSGVLRPGDRLDSSRRAAELNGVSRGSVVIAYEQLLGEGYLEASRAGTFVHRSLPAPPPSRPYAAQPGTTGDRRRGSVEATDRGGGVTAQPVLAQVGRQRLAPGVPDTSLLASTLWRRSWRVAAAEAHPGYPWAGSPALIEAISEHLRTSRSILQGTVMVTAGARDGLRRILSALATSDASAAPGAASAAPGASHVRESCQSRQLRIGVENPGYPSLRVVPCALGHEVIPVPVDAHGIDMAALGRIRPVPDAVLVTPSHQYPLGAEMSARRRFELLNWADRNDVVIIEDDYDSELRYVGEPLPALAGTARGGRVVTLGSFAKSLSPGVGLGFLVVPDTLVGRVAAVAQAGTPVSAIVQDAVAHYLASDGLRRHLARMRRAYRYRRDIFADVFAPERVPAGVTACPMDGGLNAVVVFSELDEREVVRRAGAAGLGVQALSEYWQSDGRGPTAARGVVLGIGSGSPELLRTDVVQLRGIIQSCCDGERVSSRDGDAETRSRHVKSD